MEGADGGGRLEGARRLPDRFRPGHRREAGAGETSAPGPAAGELSAPGGDNHAVRLLALVRQEAELWSALSTNILPSVIRPEMLLSSFDHACVSRLVRQDTRWGRGQETAFETCPSFPRGVTSVDAGSCDQVPGRDGHR